MFSSRVSIISLLYVLVCISVWFESGRVTAQEYTKQSVGDWIHEKLTASMEKRGSCKDDVWTTLEVSDDTIEVKHLQYRDLEFKYNFAKGENLTRADRLNGAVWDCEVTVQGGYKRIAPAGGNYKPWSDNPDQIRFYVRQVKDVGVIWYYKSTPHSREIVSTTVESDFFDSLLNRFMHPNSSTAMIENNQEIRSLLLSDKLCDTMASLICLGKAVEGQPSLKHRELALIMEKIDLEGIEPDIANAYRQHTIAWQSNNAKDIQATFAELLRAARKHKIGVMEYLSPKDEPYGPL